MFGARKDHLESLETARITLVNRAIVWKKRAMFHHQHIMLRSLSGS